MNILKTIIWSAAAVTLMPTVILKAQTVKDIPDGLIPAAEDCFLEFLTKSDPDVLFRSCVWWRSADRPENFVLGEPYPIYLLDLKELMDFNNTEDFKSALTFLAWSIPVSYDDKPRLLIRITNTEGEWRCVEFGRDPLPIFYARVEWPLSEGYKHSYIMSRKGPDFLAIEKGPERFFYPFNDRNKYFLDIQKNEGGHYPVISFDTMMMKLMDAVEQGKIRITDN